MLGRHAWRGRSRQTWHRRRGTFLRALVRRMDVQLGAVCSLWQRSWLPRPRQFARLAATSPMCRVVHFNLVCARRLRRLRLRRRVRAASSAACAAGIAAAAAAASDASLIAAAAATTGHSSTAAAATAPAPTGLHGCRARLVHADALLRPTDVAGLPVLSQDGSRRLRLRGVQSLLPGWVGLRGAAGVTAAATEAATSNRYGRRQVRTAIRQLLCVALLP